MIYIIKRLLYINLMERNISYLNSNKSIKKFYSESENYFLQRLEFIKKLEEKKIDFKEANRISKIWSNIKFKEIKYDKKIYLMVKKYDSNI